MKALHALTAILLTGCVASSALDSSTVHSVVHGPPRAEPVRIARSQTFTITSRTNNRTYQVMVATPASQEPGVLYPVLYVLDGNQYFGTATDALNRQAHFKNVSPAIVVGVGYPTDDYATLVRERAIDLTPSPSKNARMTGRFGGGAAFSKVLEEEIKPFIHSRFPVDTSQQILWGHSYAGLFALGTLLALPDSYSTYILSSPSIWWNDKEVLQTLPEFERRARLGRHSLRILITSAGDEQYRGPDSAKAASDTARMIDNATDLAERLKQLIPEKIKVERVVFDGEIHNTVSSASLSRALRFALPIK